MADSDIACNAELIVSVRDAPYDLISAEADDDLDYFSVGYARPRMPLGETWGRFGAVAVATSNQNQTLADFRADMVAMANAYNPEDADPSEITPIDPPRDVTHMGNNDNIPIPDCQNCELRACPDNYTPPSQGSGGSSDVIGVDILYKNTLQFYTASCPAGQEGTSPTYTVSAGTFTSTISQADADAQALNYATTVANSLVYDACNFWNTYQEATIDCPIGQTGGPSSSSVAAHTYSSKVSQVDADTLAFNAAYAAALAALHCAYYNAEQTASVNCTPPQEGLGPETATIPAGTYHSHISQADADAQALAAATVQAESQLFCCDPPCDVEDFIWGVTTWTSNPADTAASAILAGSGAFDVDSNGLRIAYIMDSITFCSPWNDYDITVTVDYTGTMDGIWSLGYSNITVTIDGVSSVETWGASGPVAGSVDLTRTIGQGNHTITVRVDCYDSNLTGTIDVSPLTHP